MDLILYTNWSDVQKLCVKARSQKIYGPEHLVVLETILARNFEANLVWINFELDLEHEGMSTQGLSLGGW